MYRNGEGWLNLHANHKMLFLQIELIRVSGHYIISHCLAVVFPPLLQCGAPNYKLETPRTMVI